MHERSALMDAIEGARRELDWFVRTNPELGRYDAALRRRDQRELIACSAEATDDERDAWRQAEREVERLAAPLHRLLERRSLLASRVLRLEADLEELEDRLRREPLSTERPSRTWLRLTGRRAAVRTPVA